MLRRMRYPPSDQSIAPRPPGALVLPIPVATIVIPMAIMIEAKSTYSRIAISANEDRRASKRRIIAETSPKSKEQMYCR